MDEVHTMADGYTSFFLCSTHHGPRNHRSSTKGMSFGSMTEDGACLQARPKIAVSNWSNMLSEVRVEPTQVDIYLPILPISSC